MYEFQRLLFLTRYHIYVKFSISVYFETVCECSNFHSVGAVVMTCYEFPGRLFTVLIIDVQDDALIRQAQASCLVFDLLVEEASSGFVTRLGQGLQRVFFSVHHGSWTLGFS